VNKKARIAAVIARIERLSAEPVEPLAYRKVEGLHVRDFDRNRNPLSLGYPVLSVSKTHCTQRSEHWIWIQSLTHTGNMGKHLIRWPREFILVCGEVSC